MLVESCDITEIWESKIRDVEALLLDAEISFCGIEGIDKYKKKLENEIKFLISVSYSYS